MAYILGLFLLLLSCHTKPSFSSLPVFRGVQNISYRDIDATLNELPSGYDMEMQDGLNEFTDVVYLAKKEQFNWYNKSTSRWIDENDNDMMIQNKDQCFNDATLTLALSTVFGQLEQTPHGRATIIALDRYFNTYIRPATTHNPIRSPTEFESWAGTQHINNARIFFPTNVQEVQDVVYQAIAANAHNGNDDRKVHIRTIGAGHSWASIFGQEGDYLISTQRLKGIWRDPQDPSLVTVQAGVLNRDLAEWADCPDQKEYRFCYMQSNALLSSGTVVGIFSTMSHGSANHPPPEAYVERVTLVGANSQVQYLDRRTDEFKTLLAAASLGLLGVIVDLTLKFDITYCGSYDNTYEQIPFKTLFTATPEHPNPVKEMVWDKAEYHLLMMAAPLGGCGEHTALCKAKYMKENVIVYRANRNMKPVRTDISSISATTDPYYYRNRAIEWIAIKLMHWRERFRGFRRSLHLTTSLTGIGLVAKREYSRASTLHFVRLLEMVPINDISWGFKLDPDWGNLYRAMDILIDTVLELSLTGHEDIIEFVAIRFVRASPSPLAPAYGDPETELFAFIETYADRNVSWSQYVPQITGRFNEGARSQDGTLPRPHWSKQFEGWLPKSAQYSKDAYGPQIERVRPLLQQADPQGLFHTPYLNEVFGLE